MALNTVTRWIVHDALPRVGMGLFKEPSEHVQERKQSKEGHSTSRSDVRKQACLGSPSLISALSCNVCNPGPQLYAPVQGVKSQLMNCSALAWVLSLCAQLLGLELRPCTEIWSPALD